MAIAYFSTSSRRAFTIDTRITNISNIKSFLAYMSWLAVFKPCAFKSFKQFWALLTEITVGSIEAFYSIFYAPFCLPIPMKTDLWPTINRACMAKFSCPDAGRNSKYSRGIWFGPLLECDCSKVSLVYRFNTMLGGRNMNSPFPTASPLISFPFRQCHMTCSEKNWFWTLLVLGTSSPFTHILVQLCR